MKQLFILIILFIAAFFESAAQSSTKDIALNVKIDSTNKNLFKPIQFSLKNNSNETLYFINLSCQGENYFLQYDSSKIITTSIIDCNMSNYYVCKLLPKQEIIFNLNCLLYNISNLAIGIKFYKVSKNYKIPKNSFQLSKLKYETVWSNEIKFTTIKK
jgi:hypothetical protein